MLFKPLTLQIMENPSFSILEVPKLIVVYLLNILDHLKSFIFFLTINLCVPNLLLDEFRTHEERETNSTDGRSLPASSFPLVPTYVMSTIILEPLKKKLPIVEFGDFLERSEVASNLYNNHELVTCIVCLKSLERSHEIRELSNCCHVFHRECLDMWIDQYHLTCPLCRSKLLNSCDQEAGVDDDDQIAGYDEGDPWGGAWRGYDAVTL